MQRLCLKFNAVRGPKGQYWYSPVPLCANMSPDWFHRIVYSHINQCVKKLVSWVNSEKPQHEEDYYSLNTLETKSIAILWLVRFWLPLPIRSCSANYQHKARLHGVRANTWPNSSVSSKNINYINTISTLSSMEACIFVSFLISVCEGNCKQPVSDKKKKKFWDAFEVNEVKWFMIAAVPGTRHRREHQNPCKREGLIKLHNSWC